MEPKRHVVISGTGRAGTTFLVELLTNLGLDTGYEKNQLERKKDWIGKAGLEHNLRNKNCPYIVKDPLFCDYAEQALNNKTIEIEYVIVPIRDLSDAAESRRHVTKSGLSKLTTINRVKHYLGLNKRNFKGGLWHTGSFKKGNQEFVLLNQFYKLMFALSNSDIRITCIQFPRSVKDGIYLFEKLKPILRNIDLDSFMVVFNNTVDLKLVHNFSKKDN